MSGRRIGVITTGLVLMTLTLSACGGSSHASHSSHGEHGSHETTQETTQSATQSAPVVQGGAPGEAGKTISPSDAPAPDAWSRTDANFVTMMIPHHAQALEMTRLARAHSTNPDVLSLAKRITAAQGPEIVSMSTWLDARDLRVPRASDPKHTMAGMLTEDQMTALGSARGTRFDRLFLIGMVQHHQGAIAMADPMATTGRDAVALEMATDIETTQKVEIAMMKMLLAKL